MGVSDITRVMHTPVLGDSALSAIPERSLYRFACCKLWSINLEGARSEDSVRDLGIPHVQPIPGSAVGNYPWPFLLWVIGITSLVDHESSFVN